MKPLPTMTILRNGRPVLINVRDYDPEQHGDPASAPQAAEPVTSAAPQDLPASAPQAAAVVKRGRRWFVTDATGNDVTAPNIDPKGYTKEQDAWDVILQGGSNA